MLKIQKSKKSEIFKFPFFAKIDNRKSKNKIFLKNKKLILKFSENSKIRPAAFQTHTVFMSIKFSNKLIEFSTLPPLMHYTHNALFILFCSQGLHLAFDVLWSAEALHLQEGARPSLVSPITSLYLSLSFLSHHLKNDIICTSWLKWCYVDTIRRIKMLRRVKYSKWCQNYAFFKMMSKLWHFKMMSEIWHFKNDVRILSFSKLF